VQQQDHWNRVYTAKAPNTVSWFQEHAAQSLRLIRATGVSRSAAIIDVGGGASTLVDDLIDDGYSAVTVLDLSPVALAIARRHLGPHASNVTWLEGDITTIPLTEGAYDVWHDRAVFHFLTTPAERHAYVAQVLRAVKPGGHVIIATFAEDGPSQCSGLPVMRYSADTLHAEFGTPFTLARHEKEEHRTPSGTMQRFVYCHFRRAGS
jgi:SAM-dependent methyltransferase